MNDIQHISKFIKDIKFTMLTTKNVKNGTLCSRPMTLQEFEFDGALWFFANRNSELVHQIEVNSQVNLTFSNLKNMSFLSASGEAHIVQNKAKEEELWSPFYKAWFPEGLQDPNLCLIKVDIHSADYWDSPGSSLVRFAGFAKAIFTGEKNNTTIGKHGHINLN